MFNVQIVNRETIKPSSPTPHILGHMQLCLADQLFPPMHVPIILPYSGNPNTEISSRLKKSLSELLSHFYPLAGRIKHKDDDPLAVLTHVECNDEGVEFYEARVDGLLSDFLRQPLTEEPSPLLPYVGLSIDIPLLIQLSIFKCGGFAIGFLISHIIADANSFFMFIKNWAYVTRGEFEKIVSPIFGFASIFPPQRSIKDRQMPEGLPQVTLGDKKVALAAKMMYFEANKIGLLREKVNACGGSRPTRVEAVSTLIWRCIMRSQGKVADERIHVAVHAVNVRGRMEPPLPEHSFGNLINLVTLSVNNNDSCRYRLGYLEGLLKEDIGKMKGDYIRQMMENEGEKGRWNVSHDDWQKCGFDLCVFTSWVRYPIYDEFDFGCGKPERFSYGSIFFKKGVTLSEASNGDGGMEALIFLEEGHMAKFEQDPELLAFVSTNDDQEKESDRNNETSLYVRGRL